MDQSPIKRACEIAGGISKMARALGVKPPTVAQWVTDRDSLRRQVPAERCPSIERATNGAVRCEDLRPDVDWAVLRCDCDKAAA
jgi:DNA-binding transcriptional regulator YdaS (Cro superfamily)